MNRYPQVMSEDATLDAVLAGASLARYGDGELSLALGGDCISQVRNKHLQADLRRILREPVPNVLVGIPNALAKDTKATWAKYAGARFTALYGFPTYASSFITRPDSAPWIDRPDYWAKCRRLWEGRDVVLVKGTERSLRASTLAGVRSLVEVAAPARDAWAVAPDLERAASVAFAAMCADHVKRPDDPAPLVLLCVGATSTVLAARLGRAGVHAVDAGHLGMFMRHAGAYSVRLSQLVSDDYRAQLLGLRAMKRWGDDGHKHAGEVEAFAAALNAESVLDYGCGEETLMQALKGRRRVHGYDPGVQGRETMPKPCDLVVSTDVLEHIEPDRLDAVLAHIFKLTGKGAYFVIATRPANAKLPDGRNAHLIVEPWAWWFERITAAGFLVQKVEEREGREVKAWCVK